MKIANWILGVLFLLFAAVQLNDPDPLKWIVLYGGIAVISIFGALGRYNRWFLWAGLSVCLIWMVTLIPDIVDWVKMGMPSITETMKAEKEYIELAREFFGVLVSGMALLWHLYASKRITT